MLRAALRNRRSRLLFANYIRAFRAFSRSKDLTAVYAYRKAQETKFYGKLGPNLKSFFGDVFSQDKASQPPLYMHTARRKKRSFTGNSARTSNHFSVMFFSQDKASKPPLYMHTARRKKRSFTGEAQPEPQFIFRRCFFARQGK